MYGITSKQQIALLEQQPLGRKHFTKWNEKEKKRAIQMCGLASSKYKNAQERNAILQHLSETELPIDPGEVQRLIRGLGLPPSGSSSLQQFAFFLLSFMSESLPFPPWKPKPVMEIVMPTPELLAKAADATIKRELGDEDDCPHAHLKAGDDGARLWQFRRHVVRTHCHNAHAQHTCHPIAVAPCRLCRNS